MSGPWCKNHNVMLKRGRNGYHCPFQGCTIACSGLPTSIPADRPTRKLRKALHAKFDPLWADDNPLFKNRLDAYGWLARKLQIEFNECHIGMFDMDQCRRAFAHLDALLIPAENEVVDE